MQGPQGPQGANGVVTGTFGKTIPYTVIPRGPGDFQGFDAQWFAFDHQSGPVIPSGNDSIDTISWAAFVVDRVGTIDKLSTYFDGVSRNPSTTVGRVVVSKLALGGAAYVDLPLSVPIVDGSTYQSAVADPPIAVAPGDRIAVKMQIDSAGTFTDMITIAGGGAASVVYRYAV